MKTSFFSLKITPPIGVPLAGNGREDSRSRGIHDDLFANFAYLASDTHRHLFIEMDLLGIKKCDADAMKANIERSCNIPAANITITATHTHSGPNTVEIFKPFLNDSDMAACLDYRVWLVDAVSSAAPEVIAAAADSQMAHSRGIVDGFSFNRRVMMDDGTLRMVFEDYDRDRIVRLAGPNGDSMMHAFVFTDLNAKVKGLILQYTSHPAVVCGEDWLYTRDYIHTLTEKLKQYYGQDVVVLYMNGAQGNQVAANPYKPFITGFAEAERVGMGLAEGAIRIIDGALENRGLKERIQLLSLSEKLTLPLRRITKEEAERAQNLMGAQYKGAQLHGLDPRVEALSILEMAGLTHTEEETLIQAIVLGDALILTFPGEVFLEHAINALAENPFCDAMIFGLANDYVGYIPTKEAFSEGGYEVKTSYASSRYDPCAGDLLTAASRDLIRKIAAAIHMGQAPA